MPHLTVWYNTRCPVCDAGINRQRTKLIAAVKPGSSSSGTSTWSPTRSPRMVRPWRTSAAACMPPMRSAACSVGADVAIAVWRLTPGERWLALLAGNPIVRPVTRFVYDRFADQLYAWNRRKERW